MPRASICGSMMVRRRLTNSELKAKFANVAGKVLIQRRMAGE